MAGCMMRYCEVGKLQAIYRRTAAAVETLPILGICHPGVLPAISRLMRRTATVKDPLHLSL